MIRFIDLHTGNTYNGIIPYVHYFDEQQSTNLYYVKQICFASRCQSCKVTIPENNVFKLANLTSNTNESKQINSNRENINGFEYVDKDTKFLRNKNEEVNLLSFELKLQGYSSKYGYLYMIYVIGSSDSAGEFHENITITESNKDSYTIEVAADFTAGDEAMINGIHNYGAEIPERIQQAIYESDLREDATDNILMNRKWKELLINFIDILNNKGNYKSLENSLNWFEYGDKIKLAEYWHKDEAGYEKLLKRELTKIADNEIMDMITYLWKTTYISIMMPLNKWIKSEWDWTEYETKEPSEVPIYDENGNIISYMHPAYLDRKIKNAIETYDREALIGGGRFDFGVEDWPNPGSAPDAPFDTYNGANIWRDEDETHHAILAEPIPELYKIGFIWSRDMLMLKMALVNLYFEKYFLPIHIDSLFGSVEELIYTNVIKITYDKYVQIDSKVENHDTIYSNIKEGSIHYMQDCNICVINSTPFKDVLLRYDVDNNPEQYQAILGIDYSKDVDINDVDGNSYYYNGPGCIVPFNCTLKLSDDYKIYKGEINVSYNKDGAIKHVKRATWNINNDSDNVVYKDNICYIDFKIILFEPGDVQVSLKFDTNSYHTFVKEYNIHISDTSSNYIDLYRVKRRSYDNILAQINKEAMIRDGKNYVQAKTLLACKEMPETSDMNKFMWTSTPTVRYDYYAVIDTNHDSNARKTISNSWVNITDNKPHVIDLCMPPAQIRKMFNEYKDFTDQYAEYFASISLSDIYNIYSYKYNIAGDVYYDTLNSIDINFTIKINPKGNAIDYKNDTVPVKIICRVTNSITKEFDFTINIKKTPNTSSTSICNVYYDDEMLTKNDPNTIGLNKCIYIDLNAKPSYELKLKDSLTTTARINSSETDASIISKLEKSIEYYWWGIEYVNNSRYLIGIKKYFNVSTNYSSEYVVSSDLIDVKSKHTWVDVQFKRKIGISAITPSISCHGFTVKNLELSINGESVPNRISAFDLEKYNNLLSTEGSLDFVYEYDFIDENDVQYHRVKKDKLYYIDSFSILGGDNYTLDVYSENELIKDNNIVLIEDRFIPLLHTIEKLEDNVISQKDCTCIIPTIDYSTHDATLTQWCFVNRLTGEAIYPTNEIGEPIHSIRAPFFTDNTRVKLPKGVYDIVLTYSLYGEDIVKTFKDAVIVK